MLPVGVAEAHSAVPRPRSTELPWNVPCGGTDRRLRPPAAVERTVRRPTSSSRPALAVELDRVAPQHLVDVVVGEPGRQHRLGRSRTVRSGSLRPQSAAEFTSIRSVPYSCRIATMRCSSILVSG